MTGCPLRDLQSALPPGSLTSPTRHPAEGAVVPGEGPWASVFLLIFPVMSCAQPMHCLGCGMVGVFFFSCFLHFCLLFCNVEHKLHLIKASSMSPCPSPSTTAKETGCGGSCSTHLPSVSRMALCLLSQRCFEMKISGSFRSKVMCFLCRRSTALGSPQCRPPWRRSSPITRS